MYVLQHVHRQHKLQSKDPPLHPSNVDEETATQTCVGFYLFLLVLVT